MQITVWEGHGATPLQFYDCEIMVDSPYILLFKYVGKATRKRRKAKFNPNVIAGWSYDGD